MSTTSPDAVLSLPSGGGAVQGLGETFAPDPFTGSGSFSVPLPLPAGRGGLAPELALVYSAGQGNSAFGLGWGLSVPGVARQTRRGLPRYRDGAVGTSDDDTFVLSGAEDLVAVGTVGEGDALQSVRYRPRTEGLFADICRHLAPEGGWWQVRTADGLTSIYGDDPISSSAGDRAVTADPDSPDHVFAWHISRTEDLFGNCVLYDYEHDSGAGSSSPGTATYLKRIHYADIETASGKDRALVSVKFVYAERPDPFSDFRPGHEIRVRRRCTRVEVRTHAGPTPGSWDEDGTVVTTVHLRYLDEAVWLSGDDDDPERTLDPALLPASGTSLLYQVTVTGHDGATSESLPPLTMDYSRFEPASRRFRPVEGALPGTALSDPTLALVDITGDGLPDILQLGGGQACVWRNRGSGRFAPPRPLSKAPAVGLDSPGVALLDADGDGRPDLLVADGAESGVYPIGFDGEFDRAGFRRHRTAPTVSLADPSARLMDLDGDGVTDLLRTGDAFELFYQGEDGWSRSQRVQRRGADVFPNVDLADPRVRTARLSGATLPDLVLVHDGNVEVWPTLGHGRWAPRRSMRHAPRLPFGYDPRRVLFGDLDGDGLDELVYVGDGEVRVWINQGGGAFAETPVVVRGTPRVSDRSDVRIVDLYGSGTDGLLFSHAADAPGQPHYWFLDLTRGTKPYLLTGVDNGLGAVTRIAYRASTEDYLRDLATPATRWATALPFPVQVVARVTALDLIAGGRRTTEYAYHHGYWDGAEREFRGFGRVDQRDAETIGGSGTTGSAEAADLAAGRVSSGPQALPLRDTEGLAGRAPAAALPIAPSPPVESRTWFHLGAIPDSQGGVSEARFDTEHWPDDISELAWAGGEEVRVGPVDSPLGAFPSRAARRDALRALRGRAVRTELYALDGTDRQSRPYTVTEAVAGVRYEEDGLDGGRVVFPYALATRTTEWDRGDDPMHAFSFTGGYDDRGRPAHQTAAAVPRGRKPYAKGDEGAEPFPISHSTTDYAVPQKAGAQAAPYLYDRVWRETSFEVESDGTLPLISDGEDDLVRTIQNGHVVLHVMGQTLTWYDGAAFEGRTAGQVGPYGLATRAETLVITPDILSKAYGADDKDASAIPPYLALPAPRDPFNDPFGGPTVDPVELGGDQAWEAEAPDAFRTTVKGLAGYSYYDGSGPTVQGYFAPTMRARYDTQTIGALPRGLLVASLDAAEVLTEVTHDAYRLLPVSVTVGGRLTTGATYDYRHLRVRETTGPNGETTRYGYSPLGALASVGVSGTQGEGDPVGSPSTFHTSDLRAFVEGRGPASITTTRRVHHAATVGLAPEAAAATVTSVEYADGFGRVVQTRAQADEVVFGPAPFLDDAGLPADIALPGTAAVGRRVADAVTVSGHTVFDEKGRPVAQYEPYHDTGLAYKAGGPQGLAVRTVYDARGRVVRVVHPDNGEARTVYGVPNALGTPHLFTPTPWENYAYSRSDNAGRTHAGNEDAAPVSHHDTPTSAVIDALGRVVEQTSRLGPDKADEVTMRFRYDLRGNRLETVDALGRTAWTSVYDLAPGEDGGRVWRTDHLDAGTSRTVYDSAGRVIEARDAAGALALTAFDPLGRPSRVWARDGKGQPTTLRQRLVYGDDGDALGADSLGVADARNAYRLGRLWRHYDEAGLAETACYDFAGRPILASRRTIRDEVILGPVHANSQQTWLVDDWVCDWTPADGSDSEVDYRTHAAPLLEARVHETATAYDALGRPTWTDLPADANGAVRRLLPTYGRGGGLTAVRVGNPLGLDEPETVVERIAHDARGQRLLLALGNGFMTRYAYEPLTRRLARIRTESFVRPALGSPDLTAGADAALVYVPDGSVVQNEGYAYDLAGNVTRVRERTADAGIAGTVLGAHALDRTFVHDALDRLTRATGREAAQPALTPVWADPAPYGGALPDPNAMRAYAREYTFDAVGNVLRLRHTSVAGGETTWTRQFVLEGDTNRMAMLTTGQTTVGYTYDAVGRLVREAADRRLEWGADGKLRSFRTQPGTVEPSVYARYLYDAAGERVKKVVRRQGGQGHATMSAGAVEWTRAWDATGVTTREATTTAFSDETGRLAEIDAGPAEAGDSRPPVRYVVSDRLGNATLTLGGPSLATARGKVSAEGYYPYGETAWGSHAKARYRYNGKERDEESGLYNYGARYYAAHTLRFVSVDPLWRQYPQYTPYAYAGNRPVTMVDLDGLQPTLPRALPQQGGNFEPDATAVSRASAHPTSARTLGEEHQASPPLPPNDLVSPRPVQGQYIVPHIAPVVTDPISPNVLVRLAPFAGRIAWIFMWMQVPGHNIGPIGAPPNNTTESDSLGSGNSLPAALVPNPEDRTSELSSNRGNLRRNLLADGQDGRGMQAHHVIPWELRNAPLVQRAARGGFNVNGPENGVFLPA
ncbi:MAG TPA: SpvB/TcaC N-terminal domain-containing protein, partial [Rubricoccaceae bacterium]